MILDLHVHSRYSYDSLSRPRDILKAAKRKGLTGIAIADHDTLKGSLEASKINEDKDFQVIPAIEAATDAGDIIGLFVSEDIGSQACIAVIEEIRAQGGIAVLPHPYRGHKLDDEIVSKVDVIEAFNSRDSKVHNAAALALAKRWNKPVIGGSDAHFCLEIGSCRTVLGSEDVRSEIVAGNARLESRQSPFTTHIMSFLVGSLRSRDLKDILKEPAWYTAEAMRKRRSG